MTQKELLELADMAKLAESLRYLRQNLNTDTTVKLMGKVGSGSESNLITVKLPYGMAIEMLWQMEVMCAGMLRQAGISPEVEE